MKYKDRAQQQLIEYNLFSLQLFLTMKVYALIVKNQKLMIRSVADECLKQIVYNLKIEYLSLVKPKTANILTLLG